ncbi:unnamed protein product [Orchesella dallaii]|uniref:Ig-like domain-containing protein n=1 Tax=Orchesella dallaii TaxID=48710 RepID=A0ABP1QDH1_9HEXA
MDVPARWKWKSCLMSPQSMVYVLGTVVCFLIIAEIGPVSGSTYDEDEWTNWSDWSPCSRTCDGGITQQFRRCKSPHGCHGVSIRRKMCNMQPCNEYRDYRNEQCRSFNGKEYRGKRYSWEAIEDPDNPCALICRAEGTDLIAKLSPKLRDGTRCRSGSLHVCVDGRCEAVGCDLKLGSPKKVDECGICGGDGSKCTSPIYNWEMLATGPCTLNCGGGQQPVKVVCRNSLTSEVVDHFLCNSASRPHRTSQSCNIHPCEPEWQAGEWSLCSVTCGGGLRIRKVFCAQEKNGTKIQVADKLCGHIRKPSNQEPCNLDTCPYWHAGPWSPCSASCGKGYKTRNVVCRDAMNLPSSACDPELRPADNKACTDEPVCPMIATTTSTTTSTTTLAPTALVISRSGPTKKRRVKTTPPEPPSTTTELENKNYMESYSSRFPESYPTDYDIGTSYFDEELPREHTLPLIQPYPPMDNAVSFDHNAIPSEPTFVAEEWGPCSQTCGDGERRREVKCKIFLEFSRTIANLPDKECPGPKPPETESCFARPCSTSQEKEIEAFEKLSDSQQALQAEPDPSSLTSNYRNKGIAVGLPPGISMQDMTFSWKVVGYSPCTASCLGGIQEAMIQCVRDYDQRIATPVLCMDKAQPDIATTRTCNDHPCPPRWNVSDFGPCSKPCGGGVMIREVNCIHEVTRGNTVIVPNVICPQPAPKTERLCNAVHCPPYWEPGEWSRCSKPCGGGERTRPLYCKQITALGQIIDLSNGERHCPQNKPIETRPCNQKPCSGRKGAKQSASPNDSMTSGTSSGRSHAYMQQEWKKKLSLTVRGHATVYNGISLKLRCPSGKGVDRTRLVWMKGHDYVNIQPHKLEVLDKHGILKIKNTTFSDSGIYICLYNSRPVSNITLMVRPYTGPTEADSHRNRVHATDKRQRERGGTHDSTLFADQQPGVSVPMSDERESIITPNSKIFSDSSSVSTSSSSRLLSPLCILSSYHISFSSLVYDFSWLLWPLTPLLRKNPVRIDSSPSMLLPLPMKTSDGDEEPHEREPSEDITETTSATTGSASTQRIDEEYYDNKNNNVSYSALPTQVGTSPTTSPTTTKSNEQLLLESEYFLPTQSSNFDLEEQVGKRTMGEVVEKRKGQGREENGEENVEEMIGMKTKVSTSTITATLVGDHSSTTSSPSTTNSPTSANDNKDEFGLHLPTESAQVLMPTHASLSTSTSHHQRVDYYEVIETTTRTTISDETTKERGEDEDDEGRTEIVEPYLLECQDDSGESLDDTGMNMGHNVGHPHRHGHNSNYNRYRSNRRRRRWRNNHIGSNNADRWSDASWSLQSNDANKRPSVPCPTNTHEDRTVKHHHQRRGIWKVGNWSLCDNKECFTWNTA